MSQRYGEESNAFRVRVLGSFLRVTMTLQSVRLVEAAQNREVEVLEDEPIIWGLDVARFGSAKSVLCKRQGRKILALTSWKNLDLMRLAGAIVAEYESLHPRLQPQRICIDSIGVGGGVCDRL